MTDCKKEFITKAQLQQHLKSRKHVMEVDKEFSDDKLKELGLKRSEI